jgi:hypothetical protein
MNNSISTNGLAGKSTYRGLLTGGMSRFYISLDTLNPTLYDSLTRSTGRLPQVLETIENLVSWKRRNPELHITVNVTINKQALQDFLKEEGKELKILLRWLRSAGVDDFKFLPVSSEDVAEIFPEQGIFHLFKSICEAEVPGKYRMFHLRLATLTGRGHGFSDDRSRSCFLTLDDRTYDPLGAYACIIQLREGGKRLYEEGMTREQKADQIEQFLSGNRTADPICRRCCYDLYRRINDRVDCLLSRGTLEEESE